MARTPRPRRGQETPPPAQEEAPRGPSSSALERRLQMAARRLAERGQHPPAEEPDTDLDEDRQASEAEPDPEPEDEAEWTADLPPDTPEEEAARAQAGVEARPFEEPDVDRLWDWIRQDSPADRKRFIGHDLTVSRELWAWTAQFGEHLVALYDQDEHIGFGGFHPVTDKAANMHLYLRPQSRNQLKRLLPQLLSIAAQLYPGRTFMVATPEEAIAQLYKPYGFRLTYLLSWTPPVSVT